ncbi:SDR family NAD(P)-dependent oxidoreductase [Microbacterium lushaniae]|uniref:SDR family oxidoreductase n=1 Tax=Microbacterium lushaniae TaxID=2614639 RepID=A0A5J6L7H8_9MICO|nr:SDR family NAD(P)-dependent oxidoreductase [Microbacterium lushaniae]QEW04356.1 SDR family oxidoreductase [Microbacterium lushaniae]
MTDGFDGRVALVTGAASGIGRAVALELAGNGAKVVAVDLKDGPTRSIVDEIVAAGGSAIAAPADVADARQVKSGVDAAVEAFGGLHLAFNNAGIGGPQGLLGDYDDSDGFAAYQRLIDINLNSVYYGMRYEIPAIIAAGGGAIVNTSSILGIVGEPGAAPYTAAKHGVAGMTKSAGAAYAAQGVRINSVHPGYIDTPLLDALPREAYEALVQKHPIGRLGTAEEVAHLVVFLLSDRASFINGSQYLIDGGYTAV